MIRKKFVYHENQKCPVSDEESDLFDDKGTEMESNQQLDCLGNRSDQSIAASEIIKSGPNNNQFHIETSRRTALFQLLALSTILSQQQFRQSANASPEIDSTGSLFSPKAEMISGGGSQAARGIPLKELDREDQRERNKLNKDLLKRKGLIQDVYETRFITYLARFLLVFDPAARAWWKKKTQIKQAENDSKNNGAKSSNIPTDRFAEFAESVEVGLADYFLGPYGSYASVAAAKAGIAAAAPAKSARGKKDFTLWDRIFGTNNSRVQTNTATSKAYNKQRALEQESATKLARQGVLNLFSLLKARYTSVEEKRQLAILFSMISSPDLQPVREVRGLLGEIDNGTIAAIELLDLSGDAEDEEDKIIAREYFRLSSRQGGGFSKEDNQVIKVEPPAPLGDDYKPAKIRALMKPTTRILRIKVVDGGEGYTVAPDVIIKPRGVARQCEACAIIDRKGSVSDIIVLNPGYGYGGEALESTMPTVEIREKKFSRQNSDGKMRPAIAVAELEYKVVGVEILDGGSGYLFDEPPEVSLRLPKVDPDWFVTPIVGRDFDEDENQLIAARVSRMRSGSTNITVDPSAMRSETSALTIGDDVFQNLTNDPIALLPSNIRPQFSKFRGSESTEFIENGYYYIPSLPSYPANVLVSSPNCRSIDPLFGGIGKAPVTKSALSLTADQYSRLALSGAICTVIVREALNPLELVKTKIQLGNDEEILQYAAKKSMNQRGATKKIGIHEDITTKSSTMKKPPYFLNFKNNKETHPSTATETESKRKYSVGTTDVIQSIIEVRGVKSLFQSADITLLTSIVFGLFGFGATELFRRSFSAVFFDENAPGSSDSPNEFVLLAAAAFATLLTCAAGAPFEILRVRSMSLVEAKGVKEVLGSFVEQNRAKRSAKGVASSSVVISSSLSSSLSVGEQPLQLEDIKPLWSSFNPIVSRELPFAVTKFLVFDLAAETISDLVNNSNVLGEGNQVQVGVGTLGLLLSALAGALAGIAGAFVSHPADLILTLTSTSSKEGEAKDWRSIVKELLAADGGALNFYAGFPARAVFFFMVIGLQFFLYDYIKTLLDVGTDDLTLVLDVFYAIRQGLLEQ